MEKLLNGYLKIEPIEHNSFISQDKGNFEEVGIVLAKDETPGFPTLNQIPIGSRVFFDSFMAKKYPVPGEEGKFQWYIHFGEIVKYEDVE